MSFWRNLLSDKAVRYTVTTTRRESMSHDFKFELGAKARDIFTGFEGLVVCRTQWIHNCNTYGLQPTELKDGVPQERQYFDEPQLTLLSDPVVIEHRHTGGPEKKVKATNRV